MTTCVENNMSIKNRVMSIVCGLHKGIDSLDVELDLFEAGILDSFGLISLISLLEQEFKFQITAELTEDNFRNINNISRLIQTKPY